MPPSLPIIWPGGTRHRASSTGSAQSLYQAAAQLAPGQRGRKCQAYAWVSPGGRLRAAVDGLAGAAALHCPVELLRAQVRAGVGAAQSRGQP